MKKIILTLFLFSFLLTNAQYCLFLDFKAEQPEMVVSSLKGMMETEWGKNIQGTKSLFAYLPNGTNEATHSLQICFPMKLHLKTSMHLGISPLTHNCFLKEWENFQNKYRNL